MRFKDWLRAIWTPAGEARERQQIIESASRVSDNLHISLENALKANSAASRENDRVRTILEGALNEARRPKERTE